MKSPLLLALHRYVGLATGVFFLFTALSGALLVYKPQLLYAWYPSLAAERHNPLPGDDTHRQVLTQLWEEHAQRAVRRVRVPSQGWPFYEVSYADGEQAYLSAEGRPLVTSRGLDNPVLFLFDLHAHWLGGHWGEQVNGYVHLGVLLLLVLGLYAWWPRRWRKSLRLALRGSLVKLAYSWHRVLGVLAALILLVAVGTGAMMVFYLPVRTALVATLGGEVESIDNRVTPAEARRPLPELYRTLQDTLPDGTLRSVGFPQSNDQALVVRKRMPGEWHQHGRSFIYLDPYTGEAYGVIDASQAGMGLKLTQKIYPLHSGAVGGLPYQLLLTFAGLVPLILVPSGFYIWWWRRPQRRRATSRSQRSLVQRASS